MKPVGEIMNSKNLDYMPAPDSPKMSPPGPSVKHISSMPLRKGLPKQNQMPVIILSMDAMSWIVSFVVGTQAAVWCNMPSQLENLAALLLMLVLHKPVASLLQVTYVLIAVIIRSLVSLATPKDDVYTTITNKLDLPPMTQVDKK